MEQEHCTKAVILEDRLKIVPFQGQINKLNDKHQKGVGS